MTRGVSLGVTTRSDVATEATEPVDEVADRLAQLGRFEDRARRVDPGQVERQRVQPLTARDQHTVLVVQRLTVAAVAGTCARTTSAGTS